MSDVLSNLIRLIRVAAFVLGLLGPQLVVATEQTDVDQAQHSVDAQGVPQLTIEGVGVVNHPAWTALYALAYAGVEDYDPALGLKPDPVRFEATIDWLKRHLAANAQGQRVWPYRFDSTYNDVSIKAPWSSAFAQATGIQALLAHWRRTGDTSSLETAKVAAESLFASLAEGGFLFTAGDDIWFEEIPAPSENPSHILNGHMRVLLALDELAEATGDARYRQWFQRGSDTLLRWLPLFDAGYWLRYDLNPRKDELLFRLANPYGFANPELAIDRIVLRDPLSGAESVLDVGAPGDADGEQRIAGNDWGQVEQLQGRTVRRLMPVRGEREASGSEGQMVAPYSYFYLRLPGDWLDNLRRDRFELIVEYLDEAAGNLEVQMRSIAPVEQTFHSLPDGELLLSGSGRWRSWRVPLATRDLGYWVGETYGRKHAEYLSRLALPDPRLEPWAEVARAYLAQSAALPWQTVTPQRQEVPAQTPVLPWYSMDANGVLMMHVKTPEGPETGLAVYSPYIAASQALEGPSMAGLDNILKKFGIPKESVKKEPAINWLLDPANQHRVDDSLVYKFDFLNIYNDVVTPPGWQSAFAQNYAMKALLQYRSKHSKSARTRELLAQVLGAYAVDVSEGGLAHNYRAGGLFYEEVPNRSHVLNAQLSALPIIHQVADALDSPQGQQLFGQGVEALRNGFAKFDTGYWLRYDLNPRKELLFQLDWLSGDDAPLIESATLQAPQFGKQVVLSVGAAGSFEGMPRVSGLDWSTEKTVDGRNVRSFANGYRLHQSAVTGGTRHNVYLLMPLPEVEFSDYFDVQPHRLVVRYKDVAAGQFAVKIQSINEGNALDFVPLHNAVITTTGDQQWKEAVVQVRPQDMGWYKGADYQVFELEQLQKIAELTGDWFFAQYVERQRYFLEAKSLGRPVIVQPDRANEVRAISLTVIDASPTYPGYGFENALDDDPNDDYVAGVENAPFEYVVLHLQQPITSGVMRLHWESPANFAQRVRVLALGDAGQTRELAFSSFADGNNAELELAAEEPFQTLRLEFSAHAGQPRVLLRLISLDEELSPSRLLEPIVEAKPQGEFLSAWDVRNPLTIYRLPVSERVRALSDRLTRHVVGDHQKILALMDFIDGFEVGVASALSPEATIDERLGACGSFTNTLLALAAAQGFEGRVVSLLNYPANDGHAVAELLLSSGWALYDPTYHAFYTLKGSERPLSFDEITKAYRQGLAVEVHRSERRSGADLYTGMDIFSKANPAGVIGPDKPFVFPLSMDVSQRASVGSSEFGTSWQGARFIGAASTNQQQDWVLNGLVPGHRYAFKVTPGWLGGERLLEDTSFVLRALVTTAEGGQQELKHDFDFSNGNAGAWEIPFEAFATEQKIQIRHDYMGPKFHYLSMESYQVVKK